MGACSSYIGPIGSNNYVKMAHNGFVKVIVTTRTDKVPTQAVHIVYTSVSNRVSTKGKYHAIYTTDLLCDCFAVKVTSHSFQLLIG